MNKRIVSILLAIVMIFGSAVSLAVEGDIIHTGLKKIYRKNNSSEQEEMVNDILNGAAVDKFYREISNEKYVNIKAEEDAQFEALAKLVQDKGLKTAEEIREYIANNSAKVKKKMDEAKESVEYVSIDINNFHSATNAPLLTKKNYSTPEPGYKEGTTKITTLNLPSNASSWRIQVLDNPVEPMKKDYTLKKANGYIKGRDIEIESGKYLVLYAVDSGNRIKAYANIKITNEMIKQPREEALELEVGSIVTDSLYAGTMIISELDKLPQESDKWQVVVSSTPVDKVYKGDKFSEAVDYKPNEEIPVANEYELENMNNSFKKYVILLSTDNDGKAIAYRIFEVGKDDISKAPTLLKETTNYVGPIPGSDDETTIFSYLGKGTSPNGNMKEVTKWQTKVYDEKPQIPILDSVIKTANEYMAKDNLSINVGQYLLLLGTDDDSNIKGYKIFEIAENQVKSKTAPVINESNYTTPEKGSKSGTTKISTLKFDGIDGNPTKWMYIVENNLQPPMLNKNIAGSVDYIIGEDIKISIDKELLILATDDEGKVKAYVLFKKDNIVIKDPPPVLLKEGVHYSTPVKGETVGTTKFENLIITDSLKDSGSTEWQYIISDKPFDVPELNGKVEGTYELKTNIDIGEKLKGNEYILILATDNDGKVKGYATFQLKESYIKMTDAPELETKNYSEPIPGTASSTTRIPKLSFLGLEGATQWRYKISKVKFETPELNNIIDRSTIYTQGANIPVSIGDNMILLATDGNGKIKAYKTFEFSKDNIKAPNARGLMPTVNYSEPKPGSEENSTKFSFLNLDNIDGATKWMYVVGDNSFRNIEIDSTVKDANPYEFNNDIAPVKEGQYLLLLATDGESRVKAYREFKLNIDQIKGSDATSLDENRHYKISPGTLPGTSKLTDLGFWGIEGATRWKVKVLENDLDNSKPYTNSIVDETYFYNESQNIQVLKNQYILLLATDSNSRTKAYAVIEVGKGEVREYAPVLKDEDIKLSQGSKIDSVKITGKNPPTDAKKWQIIVQNTKYTNYPAVDQVLTDGKDYTLENDIPVVVGQYVTIFAVDDENKIKGFKSIEITSKNIKKVKATMNVNDSINNIIPEGNIVIGGEKITITLDKGATWAKGIKTDEIKRATLYNGFKPDNQSTKWQKIVSALIADGNGAIFVNDNTLNILIPEVIKYNIAQKQEVTLTIPANCIEGAINPVKATGNLVIMPTVKATISGDVVSKTIRNEDIVTGGNTIVIKLADGSWKSNIARDKLISGFSVVGESKETEWSKIAGAIDSSHIVRNSSKKVTITLPKIAGFDLGTSQETIKLEIPQDLIEGATSDVVATPTFTIYPDRLQVKGNAVDGKDTITVMAPDNKELKEGSNTWTIEVTEGTLKKEITTDDLIITGLPRGLKAEAKKINYKQIEISISGIASSSVTSDLVVKIRIKGSAVTDLNSIDSDNIMCKLVKGESIIEDLKNVKIDVAGKMLKNYSDNPLNSSEIEFSLESTNGLNGNDWKVATTDNTKDINFKAGKVYVREKANPKVFHLVTTLNYPKAPTGVTVSEVIYDTDGMKVKLGIQEPAIDGYDVSTDSGDNWETLNLNNAIDLTKESDLRIRYSSTESSLHSLDTKINVLDLSEVDINVSEGVITNTTTAMEYSLNGDTFNTARSNKTPVKFQDGSKIIVREKANRVNERNVEVVGKESKPSGKISYNILEKSITDTNSNKLEYRIGDDPWKDLSTNNNEIKFKPGKVQVRTKATKDNVASEPVDVGTEIKASEATPVLRVDDYSKDIYYLKDKENWVKLEETDTLEYKINDGNWKTYTKWIEDKKTDLIKNTNANISVRIKATKTTLPSQIKTVNFTGNLTFDSVALNVVEDKIEGTTTAMQYSTNSTNGKNGTWIDAKGDSTSVDFAKGMKVYIREKSKPLNFNKLIDEIGIEPNIVDNTLDYDIVSGTITNKDTRIIEYRIGNDAWKSIDRGSNDKPSTTNVEFKPGKLQFRARGTKTTLPSDIITKDIKAKDSAPELRYDDVNYKIEKIGTIKGKSYEYSINGGTWIDGTVDTQFEGGDTVKIRIIANKDTLPSQEHSIKFTSNLDLNKVVLNAGKSKLVDTNTLMEYSTNSTNGENGIWISCTGTETILKLKKGMNVYIREKNKPRNVRKVTTEEIKKKDFTKGTNFIENNIDYNILQGTISIKNPTTDHQKIVNDLQYRINNSNWVNIDYVVLKNNVNRVLAYNVNFVQGNLEFRLRGNENTLPSDCILKDIIKAPESAPNVSVGFDTGKYRNKVNITNGVEIKNLEYSLTEDNGPWIDGEHLNTEDLVGKVYIRTKAINNDTEKRLPSLAKELTFTPVLNLKAINLSTHITPYELNGTTTDMEYAVMKKDESQYEKTLEDGTKVNWFNCQKNNTPILEEIEKDNISEIWIRDKNQPENQFKVWTQL